MSFDIPESTPITQICNTSVYDGCLSVRKETDVKNLRLALQYERLNQKRATLIRAITARIRKLGFDA
jgi:hypothetical protein